MAVCTCDQSNPIPEEYQTASDIDISLLEDWRTSTRHREPESELQDIMAPRRNLHRDFRGTIPRDITPRGVPRRRDLTVGVAVVPRRIDFDAATYIEEDFEDEEEDLGIRATETLQRLKRAEQRPVRVPESTAAPGTYKLRHSRPTQYPPAPRQYAPRMTTITPCGKCLRI